MDNTTNYALELHLRQQHEQECPSGFRRIKIPESARDLSISPGLTKTVPFLFSKGEATNDRCHRDFIVASVVNTETDRYFYLL